MGQIQQTEFTINIDTEAREKNLINHGKGDEHAKQVYFRFL